MFLIQALLRHSEISSFKINQTSVGSCSVEIVVMFLVKKSSCLMSAEGVAGCLFYKERWIHIIFSYKTRRPKVL